ncbi:MAG: hypothetical protein ICV60_16365 [Pyrinomonadaceae bacterium]|nr:hypothetical protein [Pyrinomonadaceae bacterium]
MKRERDEDANAAGSSADIVESGGETTAAATGAAEIGAATKSDTTHEDRSNTRPVGADTRVKVAGEEEEN